MEIFRNENQPCPVCGHPTGDCVGSPEAEPHHIIGATPFPVIPYGEVYVVPADVLETHQVNGVAVEVRIAKRGEVMTKARARELGLI